MKQERHKTRIGYCYFKDEEKKLKNKNVSKYFCVKLNTGYA